MSRIIFRESAAPTTPASGQMTLFADTNGDLSWLDDGGNLTKLVTTGATTITLPNATDTIAVLGTQQTFTARPIFSTTIGVGSATPSTSGSGITFPATQSPSTDANTLDDYEEGTWTPNFASGTGTWTSRTATYTKIGRFVMLHFDITVNLIGTSPAQQIVNIPFNHSGISASGGAVHFMSSAAVSPVYVSIYGNASNEFRFNGLTAAGGTFSDLGVMGNGTRIIGTFWYYTS